MESDDFVDRLLSQASLDAVDFASDVERILAEQVVFLRGELETCRREAIVGAHAVIESLYARIADKDGRIASLESEVAFLRDRLPA
ncbi:MAG: hypothetical protein AB7V19_06445 [Candidatus Bipolaricaulia bacterium]